MSHNSLEQTLADLKDADPRKAAEVAYVLARLYLADGQIEKATAYGRESIGLFDRCDMESLENCAALFVTLEGVALPSIIHQDVVRDRLKSLQL